MASDEDAKDDGYTAPELADSRWLHHAEAFASTSFWSVARRLPAIVRESVAIAWTASRLDTVAAIGLNLVAGVMTTLGLLATAGVLRELFAAGPTPDKVRAALPALTVSPRLSACRSGSANRYVRADVREYALELEVGPDGRPGQT